MEAITTMINALRNLAPGSNPFECVLGVVVAIVVLRMEITRNTANMPQQSRGNSSVAHYTKVLQQYAPETIGLLVCLATAATLRIHGSMAVPESGEIDDASMQAAQQIARDWPVLISADTLLSLQAMLRLLVLISSGVRLGGGPSLITQEAAAMSCGAALARAALAARSKDYMLDGPLGGNLPVALELISLALLLILCRGIRRRALMTSAFTLCVSTWISSRNHLSLAGDSLTDGLFLFAHIAELLAAFAYLSRALLFDTEAECVAHGSVALRFAHVIMPLQACLSAYYFVQAFEFVPQLVGAGHPFEILQFGCVAQVGAYAGAALLHWAESAESHGSLGDMPRGAAAPVVL